MHHFTALLLSALAAARASDADALATLQGSIPLPGVSDAAKVKKLDHAAFFGTLLFISAKENNTIAVVDTASNTFVTSLGPIASPQGIAVTQAGLVCAASSDAGAVMAWAATPPFAWQWSAPVGLDADNVRVDDAAGLLWVAHGGGATLGQITPLNSSTGALVDLPAVIDVGRNHPEELSLSPITRWLSVSVPADAGGAVLLADRSAGGIPLATWPGSDSTWQRPSAQRQDSTGTRLYVATAGSDTLPPAVIVLNALDGTLLWSTPTQGGCDGVRSRPAGCAPPPPPPRYFHPLRAD